jgi:lysophospholipase L1-like esterase
MNLDSGLGRGIQQSLEAVSGRDYRNYAQPGTQVLTEQIPNQYNAAHDENPNIKTVVMTGGGNDILLGRIDCSLIWDAASCEATIDDVQARLDMMRVQMAEDGVEDVLIVSYGYPANEMLHNGLNYSRMILPEACKTTDTPRCHYIDPVEELEGKIDADGIHPNQEGYDVLGQMVWDMMQERGLRR